MIDDSRQARWENRTEAPLAVASLLFLGSYAVRVLTQGLPPLWRDVCVATALATWAVFALDYAVRWRLSGQRLRFVRTHWLDTVVLALPLLRPLRIVHVCCRFPLPDSPSALVTCGFVHRSSIVSVPDSHGACHFPRRGPRSVCGARLSRSVGLTTC